MFRWETKCEEVSHWLKNGDFNIYNWENTDIHHFKILDEYAMCLSQGVLFLEKSLHKNVPRYWNSNIWPNTFTAQTIFWNHKRNSILTTFYSSILSILSEAHWIFKNILWFLKLIIVCFFKCLNFYFVHFI